MEHLSQPNLLLEALACLGRKTTGKSWEDAEQRFLLRKAETEEAFDKVFDTLKPLTDLLTQETRFSENTEDNKNCTNEFDKDEDLFHNMEGLPCNVVGLCSPAFLLFYPMLGEFDGDIAALTDRIAALPPSQIAKNILDILSDATVTLTKDASQDTKTVQNVGKGTGDLCAVQDAEKDAGDLFAVQDAGKDTGDLFATQDAGKDKGDLFAAQDAEKNTGDLCAATVPTSEVSVSAGQYMRTVLSLNLPDSSKLALLDLYNNYPEIARQAATHIAPLLEKLQQELPAMMTLISQFADGLRTIPREDFFGCLTRQKATDNIRFRLHPFLLGLDTVLAFRAPGTEDTLDIYCGFLREQLAGFSDIQPSLADRVFSSYRLLGDRTRYDILCYLKDHPAYGQELSFRFGLARNTIHHHMSKLLEAGLVNTTVRGNRVYYTLNTSTVGEFLDDQRKLLRPENGATPTIPEYGRPYLPYI